MITVKIVINFFLTLTNRSVEQNSNSNNNNLITVITVHGN